MFFAALFKLTLPNRTELLFCS